MSLCLRFMYAKQSFIFHAYVKCLTVTWAAFVLGHLADYAVVIFKIINLKNIYYSQMKETFSKSSVSCLMRANLRTIKGQELNAAEGKDDPCWQVTQQLHFLIEKVSASEEAREVIKLASVQTMSPFMTCIVFRFLITTGIYSIFERGNPIFRNNTEELLYSQLSLWNQCN